MKIIAAILFILGCGWALLAWMVVLLPLGIFIPDYRYQSHDVVFALLGSFLGLVGYWLWFCWGFRWKTGRYPLVSARSFWAISLLIHILWALTIPFGYSEAVAEFWSRGDALPFRVWIPTNIVAAVVGLFVEPRGLARGRIHEAEASPGE
jgi:hypothetical protein